MGEALNQFYLNNNPLGLGSQGTARNTYGNSSNCSPFYGAYGQNSNIFISGGFTTFLYNGSPGNFIPNITDMLGGNKTNFFSGGLNNSFNCSNNPPDYVNNLDALIARDTLTFSGDAVNYKWWNQHYLYKRLLTDTALLNSDSIFYTFKNTYKDSLVATLTLIEEKFASLAYDSSNNTTITWLRDTLNHLSSSHRCGQNYLNYFKILLDVISTGYGNLDSANHAGLVAVASQCPYTGGQAVYLSRALLSEFDTLYYDDDDCENLDFSPRIADKNFNSETDIIIFPNPANNELNFSLNAPFKILKIQLFDIAGRPVASQIFKSGDLQKLNIASLQGGIYFYSAYSKGVILNQGKVTIIH